MTFQAVLVILAFLGMFYLQYVNQKLKYELWGLKQRYQKTEKAWQEGENLLRLNQAYIRSMEQQIWDLQADCDYYQKNAKKIEVSPLQKLLNIKFPKRRK